MNILDSSSDEGEFTGFHLSDTEVREVGYESEEEIGSDISVSSVHTSDLSDWQESEEEEEGGGGDAHGWNTTTTTLKIENFQQETGANVNVTNDRQISYSTNCSKKEHSRWSLNKQMNTLGKKSQKRNMEIVSGRKQLCQKSRPILDCSSLWAFIICQEEMYWSADDKLGVPGINRDSESWGSTFTWLTTPTQQEMTGFPRSGHFLIWLTEHSLLATSQTDISRDEAWSHSRQEYSEAVHASETNEMGHEDMVHL